MPRSRSHEVYDLLCTSQLGRRQVTLFGNGTVRLREGLWNEQQMSLGELEPEQVEGVLHRMVKVDLSDIEDRPMMVSGEWVERCTLRLDLGETAREVAFGRFDSLPLPLSELVSMADELAAEAHPVADHSFPVDYEPRSGDVLRRVDEVLFEVVAFTTDGKGVELQGVFQPITLYLSPDDFKGYFVALESRAGER